MPTIFINILLVIVAYMSMWFIFSIIAKRNDIADIAWGLGFILVCWYIFLQGYWNSSSLLISILTTLWGLRLALHIYFRNRNKKEDYRYKKWRDEWGSWFYLRSYLQVFLLQGFFMFLISFSVIISSSSVNTNSFNLLTLLGVLVWVVGFFFESVGDLQLSKFISNPMNKDKIMNLGLWRYTRHPNYFGEVSQWWGLFLIAFGSTSNLIAIISPLTITFLLLKVSGIPMLEKKYEGNKEYDLYKKNTSAFFPWFSKHE